MKAGTTDLERIAERIEAAVVDLTASRFSAASTGDSTPVRTMNLDANLSELARLAVWVRGLNQSHEAGRGGDDGEA